MGNLQTPDSVQKLRTALHTKAKEEPGYRFYLLCDKVYRRDVLDHAYRSCKANKGAAGVDGVRFEDIEAYGEERWLGELADRLKKKDYRPEAVKRVWIPKPNGKLRPLGTPPTKRRQLAALQESKDTFRILTAGYDLVFFHPEYDGEMLSDHHDSDSMINYVCPALEERWNLIDEKNMAGFTEDEIMERLPCVGSEGLHPALIKARWLLHAWRWCIANRQPEAKLHGVGTIASAMHFAIKMENRARFCLGLYFNIQFCLLGFIVLGSRGACPLGAPFTK